MKLVKSKVRFDEEQHRYFLGEKELSGITGTLIKKAFPDTKIVFVWAPIELLEERMRSRGDSEESIKERLENVTKSREYENCKYADYILNNIDIESARADILSYINN